ncbi:MAG: hypothetical protein AAF570_20365, partial [Bacteroidota bacterium]
MFPDQQIVQEYELLLFLGASVTFFWVTGLFDGFVVAYKGAEESEKGGVVLQVLLVAIPLGILSGLAVFWIGEELLTIPSKDAVPIFALFIAIDTPSHFLAYVLIVRSRHVALVTYGFFAYLAYFLALIVPLAYGQSFEDALVWLLFVAIGKIVLLLIAVIPVFFKRYYGGADIFVKLLKLCVPLAAAALLSQSAQYVDGFLVENYFEDQFAIFRYGAKELPLILLLANSMSVVRSGDIAATLKAGTPADGLATLKRSSTRLLHLSFGLSAVLLLLSLPLYIAVFGEGFRASVPVFDLYLLLVIPRLLFPQSVLRGYQKTTAMTLSAAIELVLNVGLSLLFMQWWG